MYVARTSWSIVDLEDFQRPETLSAGTHRNTMLRLIIDSSHGNLACSDIADVDYGKHKETETGTVDTANLVVIRDVFCDGIFVQTIRKRPTPPETDVDQERPEEHEALKGSRLGSTQSVNEAAEFSRPEGKSNMVVQEFLPIGPSQMAVGFAEDDKAARVEMGLCQPNSKSGSQVAAVPPHVFETLKDVLTHDMPKGLTPKIKAISEVETTAALRIAPVLEERPHHSPFGHATAPTESKKDTLRMFLERKVHEEEDRFALFAKRQNIFVEQVREKADDIDVPTPNPWKGIMVTEDASTLVVPEKVDAKETSSKYDSKNMSVASVGRREEVSVDSLPETSSAVKAPTFQSAKPKREDLPKTRTAVKQKGLIEKKSSRFFNTKKKESDESSCSDSSSESSEDPSSRDTYERGLWDSSEDDSSLQSTDEEEPETSAFPSGERAGSGGDRAGSGR
ncbi:hypothetical protein BDK51DRAFT_49722 [Blyttiomyces helicus]|uniref:Uncharacterized protein n=1 Tax=Blyttiomyces helicus TaxID=388810 RepID=A0A4P9WQ33_9FUNG|nr:hypothetical protein BDK51DRAFT_49722 [Blyttiomyces helicus]|eukprot:RKO94263.1 hypothetical protein BDK51DRAFT_49722 [Blyttiomyces helicus]